MHFEVIVWLSFIIGIVVGITDFLVLSHIITKPAGNERE